VNAGRCLEQVPDPGKALQTFEVAVVRGAPDLVDELLLCHHFVAVAQQSREQSKFRA
jgi:hypothetical protein